MTVAGNMARRVTCVAVHIAVSLPCCQFFVGDCMQDYKQQNLQFFLFKLHLRKGNQNKRYTIFEMRKLSAFHDTQHAGMTQSSLTHNMKLSLSYPQPDWCLA